MYWGCQTAHCVGDVQRRMKTANILCEYEALASFRRVYLGCFFLDLEDIKGINLGAIWNFSKTTGFP